MMERKIYQSPLVMMFKMEEQDVITTSQPTTSTSNSDFSTGIEYGDWY